MSISNTPRQSSPFAPVAAAVRNQIAWSLGINPQYVRVVASDSYTVTETEDLFVYVRVYNPEPATDAGAGRLGRPVKRRFRCYVYTRTGSDSYGGDEFALMGQPSDDPVPTPAQFLAEELVLNALDDFWPEDGDGNGVTIEPIHPLPQGGPPERKPEGDAGLVRSSMDFEAVYVLAISKTEPAAEASDPGTE